MESDAGTLELLVGAREANHLSVRPTGRAHPDATDFWDANWLSTEVSVRAGAFRGTFQADLRSDELAQLAEQLAALEGAEQGTATLESAEGWIRLRLTLDGRGGLEGTCEVRDDPTGGATLRYRLGCERAERPALARALRAIRGAFPVIGDPEEDGSDLLASLGDDGADVPDDA